MPGGVYGDPAARGSNEHTYRNESGDGGRRLLIAMVDELSRRGISIKDRVLVVAQDIDSRCVNMSYIQFSLMGIPAVVMKGDTLAYKFTDVWRTPAYFENYAKFEKTLQSL